MIFDKCLIRFIISRKIGYWLKWLNNWTAFWRFSDGDHYTKWTPKTRILNLCDLSKSIWKPHITPAILIFWKGACGNLIQRSGRTY